MLDPGVRSAAAAPAAGVSVAVAMVRPNTTFCCRACRRLVLRQPKGRRQRGAAFIVSVGPRGASRWRWSGFEIRRRRKLKPRRIARFDWAVVGRSPGSGPIKFVAAQSARGAVLFGNTRSSTPTTSPRPALQLLLLPPSTPPVIHLIMSAAVCRHSLRIGSRNLASLPTAASGQTRWLSSTPSRGKDCVHFNLDLDQQD